MKTKHPIHNLDGMFFKPTIMKKTSLFLIAVLLFSAARTQDADSTQPNKVQVKLSVNYNSNLNYYGRTDSLQSSGIFPMAEIWFTPKWYINAAPIFVHNKISSLEYAGTVATLGYMHASDKFISNLYVLKPFYTESSRLVQSALKAQSGASFTFLSKVVNLTLGGDAKWSNQLDYGAQAGLDHIIRIPAANSVWILNPSAYAYAGTQNFSRSYKQKKGLLLPRESRVTETYQKFNVLSYEFSLPLIYTKNKLQVLVTPTYVLPQNLITTPGRPDLSEKGENTLFTTATIKYTF